MSNVIPVLVRHGGKSFTVDLDATASVEEFKLQIYSLTGVEPDRQKILSKGVQINRLESFDAISFKPNQLFTVFGTSTENSPLPVVKPKFLEDMDEADLAKSQHALPSGLNNLGNTCYLNSALQILRRIPEIKDALQDTEKASGNSGTLVTSLRDLYSELDRTTKGFSPFVFLNVFRSLFPQFAERSREGHYLQQDAEECFSQILAHLRVLGLRDRNEISNPNAKPSVDRHFTGTMRSTLVCDENGADEQAIITYEPFLKIDCHINITTKSLEDSIADGLVERLEKQSPTLGRTASYTKTKQISQLPKYLTCHFVRFYWKRDISRKAKIMRKVTFPLELDVSKFCTEELKSEVRNAQASVKSDEDHVSNPSPSQSAREKDHDGEMSISGEPKSRASYRLIGVITHQGASADSGHYCSYVRSSKVEDKWLFFNDDKVSEVGEEVIGTLSGGGESHSALLLVYESVFTSK